MSEMLLMATRPGESLYAVIDDEVATDGIVVGSNYARYVPLWGYLSRYSDFVEIDTDVHRVLALNFPDPARLTDLQRMSVDHFIANTVAPYEDEIGSNDFELGGELPVLGAANKSISLKAANAPWKFEPYDPDAQDGDGDGLVQDGTPWERPGGTRILDRDGNEIERGLNTETRPAGVRIVDADGNDVDYTPSWAGGGRDTIDNVVGARPPSIADQGARSLRDILAAGRRSETDAQSEAGRERPAPKAKNPKVSDLPVEPGDLSGGRQEIYRSGLNAKSLEHDRVVGVIEKESNPIDAPAGRRKYSGGWLSDGPVVREDGTIDNLDSLVMEVMDLNLDWRDLNSPTYRKMDYLKTEDGEYVKGDPGTIVKRFTTNRIADSLTEEGVDLREFVGLDGKLVLTYDMDERRFGLISTKYDFSPDGSTLVLDANDPRNQKAINRAVVDQIVHSWAIDSSFVTALVGQDSARKLLDLEGIRPVVYGSVEEGYYWDPEKIEQQRPAIERVVARMYELTQADLSDEPEKINLFRGMKVNLDEESPLGDVIRDKILEIMRQSLDGVKLENGDMTLGQALVTLPLFREITQTRQSLLNDYYSNYFRLVYDQDSLQSFFSKFLDDDGSVEAAQEKEMLGLLVNWILSFKELTSADAVLSDSNLAFTLDLGELQFNALSSFATSQKVAEKFSDTYSVKSASIVGSYLVPKQRVVSTPGSGYGCFEEAEMVVAGGGNMTGSHRVEIGISMMLDLLFEEIGVA